MCKTVQNTDTSTYYTTLQDDAPIDSLNGDKLGREQFITNLASALTPISKTKSKVIALTGTWGVGKTSVINIARQKIENENKNKKLYIIDFNPWQYTKKDDLIKPFLEEFFLSCKKEQENSKNFKKECKQKNKELNKLRKKIAKYYKNFDFGSSLF